MCGALGLELPWVPRIKRPPLSLESPPEGNTITKAGISLFSFSSQIPNVLLV